MGEREASCLIWEESAFHLSKHFNELIPVKLVHAQHTRSGATTRVEEALAQLLLRERGDERAGAERSRQIHRVLAKDPALLRDINGFLQVDLVAYRRVKIALYV